MPTHWTYDALRDDPSLAQGDIIEPTDELRSVFQQVHEHFQDEKYVAFIVLTQSCDLVRRPECSAQHITLGVVRELSSVAEDFLKVACPTGFPGVYNASQKLDAKKLFSRLLNQNEQSIGLFYLHPDADVGIAVPSVAILRVSIALRSTHYPILVSSRRGRLKPEFQAKLGWLLGNLFSRIGTTDWSEQPNGKKSQTQIVDTIFDRLTSIVWASPAAIKEAEAAGYSVLEKTMAEVQADMAAFEPRRQQEVFYEELAKIVSGNDLAISPEVQRRMLNRIKNNAVIAPMIRKL